MTRAGEDGIQPLEGDLQKQLGDECSEHGTLAQLGLDQRSERQDHVFCMARVDPALHVRRTE